MQRLNGWQRIGIVISIVWAAVTIGFATNAYIGHFRWAEFNAQMEAKINDCHENAKKEEDREKRQTLDRRCGLSDAQVGLVVAKPDLLEVLAFIFLPIVGGWLVAYLLVWVIKWVISGFRPKK